VIEDNYSIVEDNYKVEDSTYKNNKVKGRIAKEEAIMAMLGESNYY
jgi:hypothetical protein